MAFIYFILFELEMHLFLYSYDRISHTIHSNRPLLPRLHFLRAGQQVPQQQQSPPVAAAPAQQPPASRRKNELVESLQKEQLQRQIEKSLAAEKDQEERRAVELMGQAVTASLDMKAGKESGLLVATDDSTPTLRLLVKSRQRTDNRKAKSKAEDYKAYKQAQKEAGETPLPLVEWLDPDKFGASVNAKVVAERIQQGVPARTAFEGGKRSDRGPPMGWEEAKAEYNRYVREQFVRDFIKKKEEEEAEEAKAARQQQLLQQRYVS